MSDGMCDAETKKGISSTLRRAPFPSLHRTDSGSRSFPMTWTRPLNFGPDAKRPTSPERTAAFDRRRRKKPPRFRTSVRHAYAKRQDRQRIQVSRSLPENQIYHVSCALQHKKSVNHHFFRQKRVFFQHVQVCCTSFAGETRAKMSP